MRVRAHLRRSTAALHAELDRAFSVRDLALRDNYRRFLSSSASVVLPLEAELARMGVERLLPDWRDRTRARALVDDLRDLGVPASASDTPLIRLANDQAVWGACYVLEGARLGAAQLLPMIGAAPDGLPTRYLGHGAGKPLWSGFLARLENAGWTQSGLREASTAACAVFEAFLYSAAGRTAQPVAWAS